MNTSRILAASAVTIAALALFPAEAGAHSNWLLHDECATVDDPDGPYVVIGGPAAAWHLAAGGANSCHMWTYSTTGGIYNYINWYLPISSSYSGHYSQTTWIGGATFTANARYERFCCGTAGGVTSVHTLNQALLSGWHEVTRQNWYGSQGGYTRTPDLTGVANTKVGMDQINWTAVH